MYIDLGMITYQSSFPEHLYDSKHGPLLLLGIIVLAATTINFESEEHISNVSGIWNCFCYFFHTVLFMSLSF